MWEHFFEDSIDVESVRELGHEGLLGLFGWVVEDINVEVVEFDISGVDGEVDLSLVGGKVSFEVNLILNEVLTKVLQVLPEVLWLRVRSGLELTEDLSINAGLTPLENVRFLSQVLDLLELFVKGLLSHLGNIGIFHPVDGEEITEAGVEALSIDAIIW